MLVKKCLKIRIHLEGQLRQFSSLGQQVKQVLLRAGVKMLGDIMILRGQIAGQSLPVKFSIMALNDAGQGLISQ